MDRFTLAHGHFQTPQIIEALTNVVTTLTLGLRPRQRLAKVQAKRETQESHFMLLEVWEGANE